VELESKLEKEIARYGASRIKGVKNPTDGEMRAALQGNGMNLKYIDNPPFYICKIAIYYNPEAISLVEEQVEDLCLIALDVSKGEAMKFIKPEYQTVAIVEKAVSLKSKNMIFVNDYLVTVKLFKLALAKDYTRIQYWGQYFFYPMPRDVKEFAIDVDAFSIEFIKDQDKGLIRKAILKDPSTIYVANYKLFDDELRLLALGGILTLGGKIAYTESATRVQKLLNIFPGYRKEDDVSSYIRRLKTKKKLKELL